MSFTFAGNSPARTEDPRLEWVRNESQKLFEDDKAAADDAYELAVIASADGSFGHLPLTSRPDYGLYQRAHTMAMRQAEARHRARVGEFERQYLGMPLPVDHMGNTLAPRYSEADRHHAVQWLETTTVPTVHELRTGEQPAAMTREHRMAAREAMLEALTDAWLAGWRPE